MKKAFMSLLGAYVMCFSMASAATDIAISLDGKGIAFPDEKPYINEDNRTMVPVRFISQQLGYHVSWDNQTRKVSIQNGTDLVVLAIGSEKVNVNGATVTIDTKAAIENGRTFVPIRFVTQSFDASIGFDEKTRTVVISKEKTPPSNAVHKVVYGDTLYSISQQYQVSVENLKKYNNLSSNTITPGMMLYLTDSIAHTVVSGDTLYALSQKYNVSVDAIKTKNNLKDNTISPGQVLYIPRNGEAPPPPPTSSGLAGKVIVLDPGHGGSDSGARGIDGTTYEKTINLAVTSKLKTELEHRGAKVVMTRSGDSACKTGASLSQELQCRVNVAKSSDADIFVSIHANSYHSSLQTGSEIFYNTEACDTSEEWCINGEQNPYPVESGDLAKAIWANSKSVLGSSPRGIDGSTHYYVNRNNTVPSTLFEMGYMSNWNDLTKLKSASTQQTFATSIANGIEQYFR